MMRDGSPTGRSLIHSACVIAGLLPFALLDDASAVDPRLASPAGRGSPFGARVYQRRGSSAAPTCTPASKSAVLAEPTARTQIARSSL